MQLFYYVSFFFFLVTFSNDLLIPIPIVNTKVKEGPAIPAGVPNDADIAINILSK